jgi:argininosuccinate lyase
MQEKKIPTRSRNDQVLVDVNLYLKDVVIDLKRKSNTFDLLINQRNTKCIITRIYTFTNRDAVLFGMWFSAYAETLIDDITMLNAALK